VNIRGFNHDSKSHGTWEKPSVSFKKPPSHVHGERTLYFLHKRAGKYGYKYNWKKCFTFHMFFLKYEFLPFQKVP
jgi:hypothetical protein